MPRNWLLPRGAHPEAAELARQAGVSPLLGQLLWARGLTDPAAAQRFLEPRLEDLHDPCLLPDMDQAVERLVQAVQGGERILVHGDYDVDGVCSTALLTRVLRVLKADVEPFVPDRKVHGYDLRVETVHRKAAEGIRLILTADCGTVAFDAAEAARERGVDLIITDHHEPSSGGKLPAAVAVVNPHRAGSTYPYPHLAGTGVAYKLATALVQRLGIQSHAFRTHFLDLVALATCADCMPLLGENRILVYHGLDVLRKTNKVGLKALIQAAGLATDRITTTDIGFKLAPRINAIGRMDAAAHALKLLLTTDAGEADELAEQLNDANQERQKEQQRMQESAVRMAEEYLEDRILVLSSPRWHPGIVGLVAGRLAESNGQPAALIAVDEETGIGKGSCRSIPGYNIFAALDACRPLLLRCGGHAAAAGFDIQAENVPALRRALQEHAQKTLSDALLRPSLEVDAAVAPHELTLALAKDLARLEPFGTGNREPVLMSRGLRVLDQQRIGKAATSEHMRLKLQSPPAGSLLGAVYWRGWRRAPECLPQQMIDACFTLEINTYQNVSRPQLVLKDVRPAEGSREETVRQ